MEVNSEQNDFFMAGIVLYNPILEEFEKNIQCILGNVEKLVLVDNNSKNIADIEVLANKYKKNILLIKNSQNKGMAKALNQIFRVGIAAEYRWIVLFDQDSIVPDNMFNVYQEFIESHNTENIGIICPNIYDVNAASYESKEVNEDVINVKLCISSGACIQGRVWKEVDGYDEKLFVDLVDYDFCINIGRIGKQIIKISNVIMAHAIGKITFNGIGPFQLKNYNHNAFRKYDLSFSNVYLAYKHFDIKSQYDFLQNVYLRLVKRTCLVLLFEDDKISKCINIFKGANAGRKLGLEVRGKRYR